MNFGIIPPNGQRFSSYIRGLSVPSFSRNAFGNWQFQNILATSVTLATTDVGTKSFAKKFIWWAAQPFFSVATYSLIFHIFCVVCCHRCNKNDSILNFSFFWCANSPRPDICLRYCCLMYQLSEQYKLCFYAGWMPQQLGYYRYSPTHWSKSHFPSISVYTASRISAPGFFWRLINWPHHQTEILELPGIYCRELDVIAKKKVQSPCQFSFFRLLLQKQYNSLHDASAFDLG